MVDYDTESNGNIETVVEEAEVVQDKKIPYLSVYIGNDRGKKFNLESFPLTIGRTEDADLTVNDEKASRVHCKVRKDGNEFFIEDMGSTNGTFIDGVKIEKSVLKHGSSLQIGRTVMKFDYKFKSEVDFETKIMNTAIKDPLTGVFNREGFSMRANEEMSLAKRTGVSLCFLMVDVDHFKTINDENGHQAGDYILSGLAELLNDQKRKEDILGRYGGDEFILMLRGVKKDEGAAAFCERVREYVESCDFVFHGRRLPVTVSVGACFEEVGEITSLNSLIEKADKALYEAKSLGRNRVEMAL